MSVMVESFSDLLAHCGTPIDYPSVPFVIFFCFNLSFLAHICALQGFQYFHTGILSSACFQRIQQQQVHRGCREDPISHQLLGTLENPHQQFRTREDHIIPTRAEACFVVTQTNLSLPPSTQVFSLVASTSSPRLPRGGTKNSAPHQPSTSWHIRKTPPAVSDARRPYHTYQSGSVLRGYAN